MIKVLVLRPQWFKSNLAVTRVFLGPLAQSVEQQTFNLWVVGSIPTGPTKLEKCPICPQAATNRDLMRRGE